MHILDGNYGKNISVTVPCIIGRQRAFKVGMARPLR